MLTDTLIITFLLIIYLSQYMTGIQPFHFKGGFNAWMGIDSFLGSHARLIPSTQTGSGRIWTVAQYSRGKRLNWFFFANSIPWKLGPCTCMSTSGCMYLYVCGCASGCGVRLAGATGSCWPPVFVFVFPHWCTLWQWISCFFHEGNYQHNHSISCRQSITPFRRSHLLGHSEMKSGEETPATF